MIAPPIERAIPLQPYVVRVVFADGAVRDVDLDGSACRRRLEALAVLAGERAVQLDLVDHHEGDLPAEQCAQLVAGADVGGVEIGRAHV